MVELVVDRDPYGLDALLLEQPRRACSRRGGLRPFTHGVPRPELGALVRAARQTGCRALERGVLVVGALVLVLV
eukprot:611513-Prymnesium_polylepis.1